MLDGETRSSSTPEVRRVPPASRTIHFFVDVTGVDVGAMGELPDPGNVVNDVGSWLFKMFSI